MICFNIHSKSQAFYYCSTRTEWLAMALKNRWFSACGESGVFCHNISWRHAITRWLLLRRLQRFPMKEKQAISDWKYVEKYAE